MACSIAAEAPFAQQYDVIFEHMTTVSFILGVDAGVIFFALPRAPERPWIWPSAERPPGRANDVPTNHHIR